MTSGLSAPPRAAGGGVPAPGDINPLTRRIYDFGETIKAAGVFFWLRPPLAFPTPPPHSTENPRRRAAI